MNTLVLVYVFAGLLGLIVGSFLNVVVYRLGTGLSIAFDRSRCGACNAQLRWYELVPLVSFLVQRGRCRHCRTAISAQYPIVELATAVLFVLITMRVYRLPGGDISNTLLSTTSLGVFVFFATVWSLLVVLFVYDLKHKVLPSIILYSFVVLAGVYAVTMYVAGSYILLDLLAGIFIAIPPLMLWLTSSGKWIGFADTPLFFGVGSLLGFVLGVQAFVFSYWIGALVMMVLVYMLPKTYKWKSEVPFAPFIILATALCFFSQIDVIGVSLLYETLQ